VVARAAARADVLGGEIERDALGHLEFDAFEKRESAGLSCGALPHRVEMRRELFGGRRTGDALSEPEAEIERAGRVGRRGVSRARPTHGGAEAGVAGIVA